MEGKGLFLSDTVEEGLSWLGRVEQEVVSTRL